MNVIICISFVVVCFLLIMYTYNKGWDDGYKHKEVEEWIEKLDEYFGKETKRL